MTYEILFCSIREFSLSFMKKLIFGFATVFLLAGCSTPTEVDTDGPIRIGAIGALSGDAAPYGLMIQKTTDLRVAEINEAGGINGRMLKLIWEDGKCTARDASRAAQKLIGIDKVSLIFGGMCSGETLGIAPITEKKKVILLSAMSSSEEVTHAGDFVFRTYPSDAGNGQQLANYANGKGFVRVGILTEQTDYPIAMAQVFANAFGGEVIEETFLSDESDFKTRIAKLKNENLDALLINTGNSANKVLTMLQQLKDLEWNTPLMGNEMFISEGTVVEKYLDFLIDHEAVTSTLAPMNDSEEFDAFVEKFTRETGEQPILLNYVATTLDAVDILAEILKTINITDTEVVRDALYNIEHDGFSGTVVFDENGDVSGSHTLFRIEGDKFVPLTSDN